MAYPPGISCPVPTQIPEEVIQCLDDDGLRDSARRRAGEMEGLQLDCVALGLQKYSGVGVYCESCSHGSNSSG